MKYIFCVLLLAFGATASATSYYISPSGNNSNNGSVSSPWKTLSYACSRVTVSGDIIHVNAGTYAETTQSILAAGVNIVGAGMGSTIIESTYSDGGQPLVKLETRNGWLGIYGNQEIFGIKFDGNLTTYSAILVNFRSGVKIHDCTFIDFAFEGVQFSGMAESSWTEFCPYEPTKAFPSYWCTGNEFYNNIVTNCSVFSGQGYGNLGFGQQNGMKVYGNTITQTARSAGSNGYGIKFRGQGYNRGSKVYNNTITIAPQVSGKYNFSIEIWNDLDECEYYNNTIQGCIDVTCSSKRSTGYSVWIHNNTLGFNSIQDHSEYGIDLEAYQNGVIISNNKFQYVSTAINFSLIWSNAADHPDWNHVSDVHIYNNLIVNLGFNGNGWSFGSVAGINIGSSTINDTFDNFYIYNNTIVSSGQYQAGTTYLTAGIRLCDFGLKANNVEIKNNIIKGFTGGTTYSAPILANGSSDFTNLKISNNLFYGNGNGNTVKWTNGFSPGAGFVNSNPTSSDPLFVSASDFQLQSGSPAIGTGINVGLSTDYKGNLWNTPPCIGAFEYNPPVAAPALPVYQNSAIENANPSILEMTYNLTLSSSIVPSASAFSVIVNSATRTVNTVVVTGAKVQLTLSSPVVNGDKATVSYTKPAANPLQTPAGGQSISISPQSVTNKVAVSIVAVPPVLAGSTVEDATPDLIELNFNSALSNVLPDVSSFSVQVNSLAMSVQTIAVSGSNVLLTIAYKVLYGDIVTVAYTKPAANALLSSTGLQIATLTRQTVTNKVNPVGPTYLSSFIENSTPNILEINFDEIVDTSIPETSSFIVMVNGINRTINSVTIAGNSVLLTLAVPVVYGDNITVSYIKPTINHLKSATGTAAVSFSSPRPVTNNCIKLTDSSIKKGNISIYPFPAREFINISILETSNESQTLKIFDLSGNLFLENKLNSGTNNKVPLNLKSGIYIAQIVSGSMIKYVQKLIVL